MHTMPQPQRRRRHPHPCAALPYRKCQRITRRLRITGGTSLPDDALAGIFARLPDTADLVRCAATCARWGHVIATRAAYLSRSLPPLGRFLPQLAVGVFHLENAGPTARTRSAPGAPQPRFLAMASGSRLLVCHRTCIGSLFDGAALDDAIFDYSSPVASRNGRLVLELHRESRADGVTFCVCSPLTGEVVVLPPLSRTAKQPRDYGCALFTGDDLHPRRCTNFFRLLLVYNRHGCTALRSYSSDTGRWGAEARSAVTVSSRELRHIGPAVVPRGVTFWPLDHGALGVRPAADDPEQAAMDVHLLPYDVPHYWPEKRLLGVSPDNRLFFISFGIRAGANILIATISHFDIRGDDIQTGREERSSYSESVPMHQMKMRVEPRDTTLKLRWIGEKSGLVLFTMGESSGHGGTFALNLREGTVEKLADGEGHAWGSFVGFEMDWAAYLASVAHGEN